jgi:hypothetical protein
MASNQIQAALGAKVRSIKVLYNDELRRFAIAGLRDRVSGQVTLDSVKELIRRGFPELALKDFALKYTDDEKDVITVSTDGNLLCS